MLYAARSDGVALLPAESAWALAWSSVGGEAEDRIYGRASCGLLTERLPGLVPVTRRQLGYPASPTGRGAGQLELGGNMPRSRLDGREISRPVCAGTERPSSRRVTHPTTAGP